MLEPIKRAVRVVMLEKWNQSGRHRNELLRRDVHVMHLRRFDFEKVAAITDRNFFAGEMSAAVDRRIRLRDQIIFLAIAGEIFDFVRHAAVLDLAIRRFDETEFVDAREGATSS